MIKTSPTDTIHTIYRFLNIIAKSNGRFSHIEDVAEGKIRELFSSDMTRYFVAFGGAK